jgi:hypothetical protein
VNQGWPNNPWDQANNLDAPSFNQEVEGGNRDFTRGIPVDRPVPRASQAAVEQKKPTLIELPRHLYIPEGAQSIDIRKSCQVQPATTKELLMSFTAPAAGVTQFIAYGIFSDAEFSTTIEFLPEVSGARIFPYHGDPTNNFKMSLGLAPDLANTSLIPCQLTLEPGQRVDWFVTNTGTVTTVLGVRMVGYIDATQKRVAPRFGG